MFNALRIFSSVNLRNGKRNLFFIVSKQSFARQYSTKIQLKRIQVPLKFCTQIQIVQRNGFHTTEPRKIPPAIALIIRPLVQVAAFLFGRAFKKWWKKKTPEERKHYIDWLKSRKNTFFGNFF